jgi:putative FmdB family regulatory protein
MPIYEYMCEKCGSVFEELESVTNRDKLHECPGCGAKKGRRIVSTFSAGSSGGGPTFSGGSCGRGGFS